MIYVAVCQVGKLFFFLTQFNKQKEDKCKNWVDRQKKKDTGQENSTLATDFSLIKNHAILKKYDFI